MAAGTAAFFAFFAAGAAIGTADAFVSILFGFVNIISCKYKDYCKDGNDDDIFHK